MAEKARAGGLGGRVSFDYRLISPLFDDQGMVVGAAPGERGETVTTIRDVYGRRTATGTLRRDGEPTDRPVAPRAGGSDPGPTPGT